MAITAPHPFGHDITIQQLVEQFDRAKQWEDRYRLLVQLSRRLPTLEDAERERQFEITGCENRVWLGYQRLSDGTLHFFGDSEGRIVKGLLAVLLTAVEGKPPQQVLETDPQALFQRLGIYQALSASRSTGLQALIDRTNAIARDALAERSKES